MKCLDLIGLVTAFIAGVIVCGLVVSRETTVRDSLKGEEAACLESRSYCEQAHRNCGETMKHYQQELDECRIHCSE